MLNSNNKSWLGSNGAFGFKIRPLFASVNMVLLNLCDGANDGMVEGSGEGNGN